MSGAPPRSAPSTPRGTRPSNSPPATASVGGQDRFDAQAVPIHAYAPTMAPLSARRARSSTMVRLMHAAQETMAVHLSSGRFTVANVCRGLDGVAASTEEGALAAMLRRCLGDLEGQGGRTLGTAAPQRRGSVQARGAEPRKGARSGSGSIRADRGHLAMRGLLSMLRRVHDHQSLLPRAAAEGPGADRAGGARGGGAGGDGAAAPAGNSALLQGAQLLLTVKATVGALSALMEGILDTTTRLTQYLSFWKAQRRRWQVTVAAEQGPRELLQWLRLQGRQGMLKLAGGGGAAVEGSPRRSVDESVNAIEVVMDVHLRTLGRFKRLLDEVGSNDAHSWSGVQRWVARALGEIERALEVEGIDVVLHDDRIWQDMKRKRKHRAEQFGGRASERDREQGARQENGSEAPPSVAPAASRPALPSFGSDDGWDVGEGHQDEEEEQGPGDGTDCHQRAHPFGEHKRPRPLNTWREAGEGQNPGAATDGGGTAAGTAHRSISLQSVCAALHVAVVEKWPAYRARLDYALADLRPPRYLRRNWPRYERAEHAARACSLISNPPLPRSRRLATFGALSVYAAWFLSQDGNRARLGERAAEFRTSAGEFWYEHVIEPTRAIVQELSTGRHLRIQDEQELQDTLQSLENMLGGFMERHAADQFDAEERAARAKALDMTTISQAFESSLPDAVKSILSGELVEIMLVQFQFLKKELMVAMGAMDSLMAKNELNMQVMAIVPATAAVFGVLYVVRGLLLGTFRSVSQGQFDKPKLLASEMQDLLREIDRLLNLRNRPGSAAALQSIGGGHDNVAIDMSRSNSFQELSHMPPTPGAGSGRRDSMAGGGNTSQNLVLGEYDMGQLLLLLHRLGLIFETHRHFFRDETQRWLEQDLSDLLGTDLLVPQQLQTVERMYRTYGFLQHRAVHSKRWRWNWWIGRELIE